MSAASPTAVATGGSPPEPPLPATPAPRRGTLIRVVQVVFVLAVAVSITLYLAHYWGRVRAVHWHLHPGWLLASAVCVFAYYLFSGLLWWATLRAFGLRQSRRVAVGIWGRSILVRYLPGNIFMFLGRLWMSVRRGLEPERVTAAMVYEQAFGIGSALIAAALLFPFWDYQRAVTAWTLLGIPLVLVFLHPRVFAPLSAWLLRRLRREPLRQVMAYRDVLLLLGWSVGLWLLAGLGCWALAAAVTDVTAAALPVLTVAFALAFVAGMLAFVFPSGIGVREGVLAAAAAGVLGGAPAALAWALLLRLWLVLAELAFAGGATLVERTAPDERDASETHDPHHPHDPPVGHEPAGAHTEATKTSDED